MITRNDGHVFRIGIILYVCNVSAPGGFKYYRNHQILCMLQDFDFYYNIIVLLSSTDDDWYQKGVDYANQILESSEYTEKSENASNWRNDIINHYFYFSSTLEHMDSVNVTCQKILINIFVTILAYEAALSFRVCTLYFTATAPHEKKIIDACEELFEYMEWFFSFLFRDKVKGFCEMEMKEKVGNQRKLSKDRNITGPVCEILHKLNLNFLKKTKNIDQISIPFLHDEKTDVYNSQLLKSFYPKLNEVFQELHRTSYNREGINGIKIYDIIWKEILEVYTNNFGIMMRYLNAIFYSKGRVSQKFNNNSIKPTYSISLVIWKRIHEFKKIKNFPINVLRKTYSEHGDKMLRSNAVDILRLIAITHIQNLEEEENELEILFEKTGSNEPIYKCFTKVKVPFHHYLTVAASTEELFH